MSNDIVIKVENLSKEYRLGTISHGTLRQDLQSWWARIRGKEDPNSIIGIEHSAKSIGQGSKAMRSAPGAMQSVGKAMRSAPGAMQSVGDAIVDFSRIEKFIDTPVKR